MNKRPAALCAGSCDGRGTVAAYPSHGKCFACRGYDFYNVVFLEFPFHTGYAHRQQACGASG